MPDYDLGRARGKITVDVDKKGFRDAEKATDEVTESTEKLGEATEETTKKQQAQEKQQKKTTKSTSDLADKQKGLQKREEDLEKATNELNDALDDLNDALLSTGSSMDDIEKKTKKVTEARKRQTEADKNAQAAAKALSSELDDVTQKMESLGKSFDMIPDKKTVKVDVDTRGAEASLDKFNKRMMALRNVKGIAGGVGKAGALTGGGLLGGGILGGAVGLAGAGATGAVVNSLGAVMQASADLSGAIGLIPGVASSAIFSLTSLKVATNGLGEAMDAAMSGDAEAFAKSLEELSMSAQELMIGFNQMVPVIKESGRAIQESFTSGLLDYIKPLAETYMPMITTGMQGVASAGNKAVKLLADWAMQPSVMADVNQFLVNNTNAMNTLADATKPVADAILDIVSVSGDFLPQLASLVKDIATQFRDWIQGLRDSGAMAEWIQTGIDSFKQLFEIIKTFGAVFSNVFEIWKASGAQGMLGFLQALANQLAQWTSSPEGVQTMFNFFTSISKALDALSPVLGPILQLFGMLSSSLADLGTAMAPDIMAFFQGLVNTFKNGDLASLAPALGQALLTIGDAIADLVNTLGPQMPAIVQTFADALKSLVPYVGPIADAFGKMVTTLGPLIPQMLGLITPGLLGFLEELSTFLTDNGDDLLAMAGAIATVGGWIGKLSGWLDALTGHGFFTILPIWTGMLDLFKTAWGNIVPAVQGVWDTISGFFSDIGGKALEAGKSIISNMIDGIKSMFGSVGDTMSDLMNKITDWLPGSPAKKGPLSGAGWSYRRGQSLASDFAGGMDSGAGGVSRSASGIAGAASDGMGIEGLVGELKMFSDFGKSLKSFIEGLVDIGMNIAKFATTDFKTGKSTIKPKWERTVSDAELQKKKEDDAFQKAYEDATKKPGSKDVTQREGSLANNVPITVNPDGTISSPDPEWNKLIMRESGGRNVPQGNLGDINNKTGDLAKGYFQITDATWKANGGDKYAPNAMAATPQQQAEIAANIFRSRGGQPWGAVAGGGRENEDLLRKGLGTLSTTPSPGVVKPTGGFSPNDINGKHSQQAAVAVAGMINQLFGIDDIGGARNDSMPYHREGRALDVMIPGGSTMGGKNPEGKALGDKIQKWAAANADKLGLEDTIWQDFWSPGGNTDEGHSLGRAGQGATAGHFDHVHLTFKDGATVDIGPTGIKADVPGASPWATPTPGDARSQAVAASREIAAQTPQPSIAQALGADPNPGFVNGPGIPEDQMTVGPDGRLQVVDQESVSLQDSLLQQAQAGDPKLAEAIRIGQDPNSTDQQIADSLSAIDSSIAGQDQTTAAGRATAEALKGTQSDIAGKRGFGEAKSPIDQAGQIASGISSIAGQVLEVFDATLDAIKSTADITHTLVRGVKNTEDIYRLIDDFQSYLTLASKVVGAASSITGMAGSMTGGMDMGITSGVGQMLGIVQGIIDSVNAAIDLGQQAYRIASKYVAQFLGHLIGGPTGSLIGDIKFLLDEQTGQLLAWSDQNPEDKRSHNVPDWMRSNPDRDRGQKIRDLNIYAGPGQDPAETMNAAMWMVTSDQGGVFTSEY